MVAFLKVILVCGLIAWPVVSANGQDQEPVPGANDFVSGTVVELPPGKIVVNRAVLGKPPEHRWFLITEETKVEGKLRVNARVTVGFRPSDEGDVAIRIIVRNPQGPKKN